jgi:hypothetical protein
MEECRMTMECLLWINTQQQAAAEISTMEDLLRSWVKAQVHRWVGVGDLGL